MRGASAALTVKLMSEPNRHDWNAAKTEREAQEKVWDDEYWEYVQIGLYVAFGLWFVAGLGSMLFESFYLRLTRDWVLDGMAFLFLLCGIAWFLGYRESIHLPRAHVLLLAFPPAAVAAVMTMFLGTAKVERQYRDGSYEYVDPSWSLRCQAGVTIATVTFLTVVFLQGGNRIYIVEQRKRRNGQN